jgi:hypothetical protein
MGLIGCYRLREAATLVPPVVLQQEARVGSVREIGSSSKIGYELLEGVGDDVV